jgi:hypothetical protein
MLLNMVETPQGQAKAHEKKLAIGQAGDDSGNLDATKMPTLHGFEEDFGLDSSATRLSKTRSTLLAVVLSAIIIGGLAAVWFGSTSNGGLRMEFASGRKTQPLNTEREASHAPELIRQMEALKSENKELREAQQRTTRAPPAIEAEQKFPTGITVHWYSDRAALSFGIDSRPEPWGNVPLPRRPANARPALR